MHSNNLSTSQQQSKSAKRIKLIDDEQDALEKTSNVNSKNSSSNTSVKTQSKSSSANHKFEDLVKVI